MIWTKADRKRGSSWYPKDKQCFNPTSIFEASRFDSTSSASAPDSSDRPLADGAPTETARCRADTSCSVRREVNRGLKVAYIC